MDYKKYHPLWKDVIRPDILRRDGYKCTVCKIEHRVRVYRNSQGVYVECDDFVFDWAKANGKKPFTIYLQVAHLDHDKSNNLYENLKSMCPRCHSRHDAEYKKLARIIKRSEPTVGTDIKLPSAVITDMKLIDELTKEVKDITNVLIKKHEALSIIVIIEKRYRNEQIKPR